MRIQRTHLVRISKTLSFALMLKAVLGGAFAVLTFFGATSSWFGVTPTTGKEFAAAGVGGLLGAILAARA